MEIKNFIKTSFKNHSNQISILNKQSINSKNIKDILSQVNENSNSTNGSKEIISRNLR